MKITKQKIALASVIVLLIVSVVTGLVQPYMQNKNKDSVSQGSQSEKLPVPNFQFTNADGETCDFDDFKGKPIVINFWATWCDYCVQEMEDFNTIAGEYGDSVNFIFLDAVDTNGETVEKAITFLQEKEYNNISAYFDSLYQGSYMFGIYSFPTTVYIDNEGNLYDAAIGMTDYQSIKEILDSMTEAK